MTEAPDPETAGGDRTPGGSDVAEPAATQRERAYRSLAEGVVQHVRNSVPPGARVLVVSRGDSTLLAVEGREMQHFPQTRTGLYAGYHPADGDEALTHLEDLRSEGAEYLVVPATASWWLEYYVELRRYLESRSDRIVEDPDTCTVYALEPAAQAPPSLSPEELEVARTAPQVGALLRQLLPAAAGVLLVGPTARAVDVGDRPSWSLEPPEGHVTSSAAEVLAHTGIARSGGARYVVLLKSDSPSDCLDARVRRQVGERLRPICRQRLAEIYEIEEAE